MAGVTVGSVLAGLLVFWILVACGALLHSALTAPLLEDRRRSRGPYRTADRRRDDTCPLCGRCPLETRRPE